MIVGGLIGARLTCSRHCEAAGARQEEAKRARGVVYPALQQPSLFNIIIGLPTRWVPKYYFRKKGCGVPLYGARSDGAFYEWV